MTRIHDPTTFASSMAATAAIDAGKQSDTLGHSNRRRDRIFAGTG